MSAIKDDKYGIGYCSLDSLATASGIKGLTYEGVTASEDMDIKLNILFLDHLIPLL